jgi:hypothetical protein
MLPRPGKMFEGPAPEQTRFSETAPVAYARRQMGWLGYLIMILPFVAALYLLINPKGRAVEPGSYRDDKNQFAIHAPEGWVTLNRENYDAIVRQYASQLPAKISQTIAGKGLAVLIVRLGLAGAFSPSLNVVVVDSEPPAINEKSKQKAARVIAEGFATQFAGYKQESVKIIEVDSIRSLEIISTASLSIPSFSQELGTIVALRSRQVLVPGKNRSYILTFTAKKDVSEDSEADFLGALDSFRVFKRPPRFGPVLNSGLIVGLLAGLFLLLNGLLRSLGGEREP